MEKSSFWDAIWSLVSSPFVVLLIVTAVVAIIVVSRIDKRGGGC